MAGFRGGRPIPGFIMGFPALVMVLALGFGLPLLWQANDFVQGSVVVPAEVTSVRSHTDCSTSGTGRDRERTCTNVTYPTVRYRTITGVFFENEVMGFLNDFDGQAGDQIDVRYLRDEPMLVQVDRWATIWGIPAAVTAIGFVFAALFFFLRRVNARAALEGGANDYLAPQSQFRAQPLPLWVVAVTLIGPLLLTWLTGTMATDALDFWRHSERAMGEVVEGMRDSSEPPIMRFTDRRGHVIEGEPETVPFEMLNVPGRKVAVLYRTEDSSVFRAAPGAFSIWWDTILVGIFAAVFSLAFVGGLIFMASD